MSLEIFGPDLIHRIISENTVYTATFSPVAERERFTVKWINNRFINNTNPP